MMGIEFSSTWMEVRDGTGSARREATGAGRSVRRQDTNEKQPNLSLPETRISHSHFSRNKFQVILSRLPQRLGSRHHLPQQP